MWRIFHFPVLSRVLGSVLLLAGLLKAYDAPTGPFDFQTNRSSSQWMENGEILGESVFGIWLLVGLYPRLSWWLTNGCFVAFLGIAFDKAMAGEITCGCFGRLPIPPWYTFTFDAVVILCLAWVQPGTAATTVVTNGQWRWAAWVGLVLLTFGGLAAARHIIDSRLVESGKFAAAGREVRLQPAQWVGSRFPLAKQIDIGPRLLHGRWALMFYRADCSACRLLVPQYVGLAYQLASQTSAVRFAMIEVPPYEEQAAPSTAESGFCVRGKLSDTHRWKIQTPTFLFLDEGVVAHAMRELGPLRNQLGLNVRPNEGGEGSLFPDYRAVRRRMFLREIACGPLALITLLEALGKTLSKEEIDRLLNEAGDKGIDMLRLKALAEEQGLHALGVGVTTAALRQLGQMAIAQLNGVGFVAVTGYTPEGVVVVYPLQPPGILPDDLFEKSFGKEGRALLVSKVPLRPEKLGLIRGDPQSSGINGAHLRLSRSAITIGRIHRKNWESSIELTNDGAAPLKILDISTNCGCFRATVDEKELSPGRSTHLRAKGIQSEPGGFTHRIQIKTNAPGITNVPVRGYLEPPIAFDPPTVFLKGVRPKEKAEAVVELDLPLRLNAQQLQLKAPKDVPLRANLGQGRRGTALTVSWDGADKPGFYRYEVLVFSETASDAVGANLPCTVEVIPDLVIQPPSLLIERNGKDNNWRRKLLIESKGWDLEQPILEWSHPERAATIRTTISRKEARQFLIELSGEHPDNGPSDPDDLQMIIKVGKERKVSVPIRFQLTHFPSR